MSNLSNLPNIGVELEKQLAAVGITTVVELKSIGSREAWLRIYQQDPSACFMRVCIRRCYSGY